MRNPHLGRRVEQLESRCLLSLAAFANQLEADVRQAVTFQQIGGGRAAELFSPQMDMTIPQGLPRAQYGEAPNAGTPPAAPRSDEGAGENMPGGGLDSFVPPSDPDKGMEPDGGGQIELGDYGESGGSSGTDPGGTTPREERESRSVLEMLARLKYPVGADTAASDVELAEPSSADGAALESVRLDERTVDIAVSELADEFAPVRPQPRSPGGALLDVDVQIDRSAGRYQVFEVLMINPDRQGAREAAVPEQNTTRAAANNDLGQADVSRDETEVEANDVALPAVHIHTTVDRPAGTESASPLALLYSLVDEKLGSSWNRAFALVTFGLVAYIFRLQYRLSSHEPVDETIGSANSGAPMLCREYPLRHSGWFARYFKFASRRRAAASS
jgi:hypothetical protein